MNELFVPLRVLHVLLGAAWLGTAVFNAFFLMPALQDVGPDGGKVALALMRRKMVPYISSVAGVTILTGLYLYGHLTNGFDPSLSGSRTAIVFGTGGVFGLIAAILAGTGVSRSMNQAMKLLAQAGSTASAPERAALVERAAALRQRAHGFATIVAVLLILAIMCMGAGHYV
jgi:hypothetical protein